MAHVIKTMQTWPATRSSRSTKRRRCWPSWVLRLEQHGLLPQGRQGHPPPSNPPRPTTCHSRKADDIIGRILEEAARGAHLRSCRQAAGAVPVGDPARRFPLARVGLESHRPECARDINRRCAGGSGTCPKGRFDSGSRQAEQVAGWIKADIGAGPGRRARHAADWGAGGAAACTRRTKAPWSPSPQGYSMRSPRPLLACRHLQGRRGRAGFERPPLNSGRLFTATTRSVSGRPSGIEETGRGEHHHKLRPDGPAVVEGLLKALEIAEGEGRAMVIWSPDDVFSAGANLEALLQVLMGLGAKEVGPRGEEAADAMLRIRYATIRSSAAVRGLALGGRCELAIHVPAQRVAQHGELRRPRRSWSRPDPGWRKAALPTSRAAQRGHANADVFEFLTDGFTNAAMARSAPVPSRPRELGYLLWSDMVGPPHKDELLHVAVGAGQGDAGRQPARPPPHAADSRLRRTSITTIRGRLTNMRDSRIFVAERDMHIAIGRVRRRRRQRSLGRRGLPDDAGAQARAARAPEDPGTHNPFGTCAVRETPCATDPRRTSSQAELTRRLRRPPPRGPQSASPAAAVFRDTSPDDLCGGQAGTRQVPSLDPKAIEDAVIGCSFPEAEQVINMARVGAGRPAWGVEGGVTVNRFCAAVDGGRADGRRSHPRRRGRRDPPAGVRRA